MPPAEGGAPEGEAAGVQLRQRPHVPDGRVPVLHVTPGIDQIAGLTVAAPEAAIVEDERREPARGEALCEVRQAHLPLAAEPVGHDHDRWPPGGRLHPRSLLGQE